MDLDDILNKIISYETVVKASGFEHKPHADSIRAYAIVFENDKGIRV